MCYSQRREWLHGKQKISVKYTSLALEDHLYHRICEAAGVAPCISLHRQNEHLLEFDIPDKDTVNVMADIRRAVPIATVSYGVAKFDTPIYAPPKDDPHLLVTTTKGEQVKVTCVWKDDLLKEVTWTRDHGIPNRVEPHEIEKIEIVRPAVKPPELPTETTTQDDLSEGLDEADLALDLDDADADAQPVSPDVIDLALGLNDDNAPAPTVQETFQETSTQLYRRMFGDSDDDGVSLSEE